MTAKRSCCVPSETIDKVREAAAWLEENGSEYAKPIRDLLDGCILGERASDIGAKLNGLAE